MKLSLTVNPNRAETESINGDIGWRVGTASAASAAGV
jgi:hypothetical protein